MIKVFRKLNSLFENPADDKKALEQVADRYFQLFAEHNVSRAQIPRLIPELTIANVQSLESLLRALTPHIIDKTAALFGIRPQWLEGVDDVIYQTSYCYKNPKEFFRKLVTLDHDQTQHAVCVFATITQLDSSKDCSLALVLIEKIAELEEYGEQDIYRYHVFSDGWNWWHYPCRRDLKAITRVLITKFKHYAPVVPIFKIEKRHIEDLWHGKLFPEKLISGSWITDPSLEDYAMTPEESRVSKDIEELPEVVGYIEELHLNAFADSLLDKTATIPAASQTSINSKDKASKAAKAKNEPRNLLINKFLIDYGERVINGKMAGAAAARAFYLTLTPNEEVLLFRSEKDYSSKTQDELMSNAVRTLTAALARYKKN